MEDGFRFASQINYDDVEGLRQHLRRVGEPGRVMQKPMLWHVANFQADRDEVLAQFQTSLSAQTASSTGNL
jgi:hypothetical protein